MSRSALRLGVLALCSMAVPAMGAETYYVRVTGNDASDGLTPATAFATIQNAVNYCNGGGHTIYVGPGTYSECVYVGEGVGAVAMSGSSGNPNRVIGDVTGSATTDPPGAVIIDGSDTETYGLRIYGRNYYEFSFLTLQNQATYNVSCESSDFVVFSDLVVHGAPQYAFVLVSADDNAIVDNTVVRDGTDGHGVVAFNCRGTTTISRNRMYNTGALYLSTPWKDGTVDWTGPGQQVEDATGILYMFNSSSVTGNAVIENNILSDYYIGVWASSYGGSTSAKAAHNNCSGTRYGIFAWAYYGPVTAYDNIVTDSYYGMGVIGYYDTATVDGALTHDITNAPFWQYGLVSISNTSSGDPLWVNPPYGGYALRASSPAIDAGQDATTAVDIRGGSRPLDGDGVGGAVDDYGPYEFNAVEDNPVVVQWTEVPR